MMTTEAEHIITQLRRLKPKVASLYKVKEMELFGSFVRGEQKSTSDVDILVEFEEGADLFDMVGLMLFLEENLGRKVDVVPKRALREELRDEVFREALKV